MSHIQVSASRIIDAAPEKIYAVLSDYRVGHQAILPKPYFEEMVVEEGGVGAGTVIRLRMKVMGQTFHYHQRVSEPEPGRVLMETDMNTGQNSRFIVEPLHGGSQTRVTIEMNAPASPGLKGMIERVMNPLVTRPIFEKELDNLAAYVRTVG